MLFISSTKYLNIRWDGHFVVILVSFLGCSISIVFNAFYWPARNKTAIHKQHKITSLLINDYNLNMLIVEQYKLQLTICEHQ